MADCAFECGKEEKPRILKSAVGGERMDEQIMQALELVAQPVLFALDGRIAWRNTAAAPLLAVGTEVSVLIDPELLALWSGESVLHLPATLAGRDYLLSLRRFQGGLLFVTEPQRLTANDSEQMEATAVQLRRPLQAMFAATQTLFENTGEDDAAAPAQLSRSMYQLLRICCQLSDCGRALRHALPLNRCAVDAKHFFDTLAEALEPLIKILGLHFFYRGLTASCRIWLDESLVERAVYHLTVNAARNTAKGGTVTLSVELLSTALAVRVRSEGECASEQTAVQQSAPFSPDDTHYASDMGLALLQEIARLHGGALMFTGNGAKAGTTALLSLSLRAAHSQLHSPRLPFDYAGGFNHGLVEFAELLPETLYAPENLF